MNNNEQHRSGHVVVGVDTHKHMHVAAVLDTIGGILATLTIPTDTGRFSAAARLGGLLRRILAFGVEGTGSYGATLASFLRRTGHKVVEAGRPDRRLRRLSGKSDTLDAENAARAVLAAFATTTPKAPTENPRCSASSVNRLYSCSSGDSVTNARRVRVPTVSAKTAQPNAITAAAVRAAWASCQRSRMSAQFCGGAVISQSR